MEKRKETEGSLALIFAWNSDNISPLHRMGLPAGLLYTLLLVSVCTLAFFYLRARRLTRDADGVCVVVLGDIGRSPRMMYHAQSLAKTGHRVYLLGYAGTPVLQYLQDSPRVTVVHVSQPPSWINKLPRLLFLVLAPLKLVYGAFALLQAILSQLPKWPRVLLVQTPPALPTLLVTQLASSIQGSKLIIDWHNTSYSILGLRLGKSSLPTRIAKGLEGKFGRQAAAHLFVTKAMKAELSKSWSLIGEKVEFHDRPHETCGRLSIQEAHELFKRIDALRSNPVSQVSLMTRDDETPFTEATSGGIVWKQDRPALLVSSTSWTPDEDFELLLEALNDYEAAAVQIKGRLPKIVVVITGKGALKGPFELKVAEFEKSWKHVRCITAWLKMEDYPKLLGAADLGISLHSSSSGLDLPMKVVDMFGSGLPVLALDFACIGELVQDGQNGRVFLTSSQLCAQLQELLEDFPRQSLSLSTLQQGVQASQAIRWQEAWEKIVLPLLS